MQSFDNIQGKTKQHWLREHYVVVVVVVAAASRDSSDLHLTHFEVLLCYNRLWSVVSLYEQQKLKYRLKCSSQASIFSGCFTFSFTVVPL